MKPNETMTLALDVLCLQAPLTSLKHSRQSFALPKKWRERSAMLGDSCSWSHSQSSPLSPALPCNSQAAEDTYIQLEFWDENIDLIKRSAAIIRKAGREHGVIVGAPQNAKIWRMCGQELPETPRILPDSEVAFTYCLASSKIS